MDKQETNEIVPVVGSEPMRTSVLVTAIRSVLENAGQRTADGRLPLYGHVSDSTAYVVDDYPYGYTARTQIRYWLESKPKKGWRFMSQTKNPKTDKWNKPKASTYNEFAGVMYLDDKDHVQWDGLNQYSDEKKTLAFVKNFPGADLSIVKAFVPQKIRYLKGMISGDLAFSINGVKKETSDADKKRYSEEMAVWEEIGKILGVGA